MVDLSWETAALAALVKHGGDSPRGRLPLIGGMDEVGRGALAGPVCVGVAVIDPVSYTHLTLPTSDLV